MSQQLFNIIETVSEADKTPRSKIRWANGSEFWVAGVVLEDSVSLADKVLLFFTEDCPFEEALHISLVSKNGELLDQIALSIPYATGQYSSLRSSLYSKQQGIFRFCFFSGINMRLKVLDKPKRNFLIYARFVTRTRGMFAKGYLKVQREG